jgi:hypothetical protein
VHSHSETTRLRLDHDGRLRWQPSHTAVISIQSMSCGQTLNRLTTYTSPSFTLADERIVVVDLQSTTANWTGALQFCPAVDGMLYVVWCYLTDDPLVLPKHLATADLITERV